jgi:Na+-transporting methylmalonyl-CoA/oxaloacetate decarboxylase gamma subunit
LKEGIALVIAILAILAAFMYFDTGEKYRVYDCGMAEWHPDIPPKVKEECRRRVREQQYRTVT